MKKNLDIKAVENELRAGSVFFRKPAVEVPDVPEQSPPVDLSTSPQVDKSTSPQVHKSIRHQIDKETTQHVDTALKRFTTYLREESIRSMKRLAFEEDKKDYELFQEAVNDYLKRRDRETS